MLSLARIFPIPSYLDPAYVGIDISETSVKYLKFVRGKRGLEIGQYGEAVVAPGIVSSGGEIQKPEELVKVLSKLRIEQKITHAVISLPEEPAFIVRFSIPYVEQHGVRQAIELALEEHVPLPPQDAVFDYEILREPRDSKDSYDLVVAVVPRELVESYLSIFARAGIVVVACEIEASAAARAVLAKEGDRVTMLVDLGKMRTGITICRGNRPLFTSTIPLGGEMITSGIKKALGVKDVEAERLKVEVGLSRAPEYSELLAALVPVVAALKDEMSKHYMYWHTHSEPAVGKIEKFILCGGQANLPGLAEFLSSDLGIPVELANPWSNVFVFDEQIPAVPFHEALRYTTAIGLALRRFV